MGKNEGSFGYCAKEPVMGGWVRLRSSRIACHDIDIHIAGAAGSAPWPNNAMTVSAPLQSQVERAVSIYIYSTSHSLRSDFNSANLDQHLPLDSPARNFKILDVSYNIHIPFAKLFPILTSDTSTVPRDRRVALPPASFAKGSSHSRSHTR